MYLIILKKIRHAFKSKYNLNRENQVILLMITDGKKWHYLAVKNLSALFRGITSNTNGDFYCLNCVHSFRTQNKTFCENHDCCYVEKPKEKTEIQPWRKIYESSIYYLC